MAKAGFLRRHRVAVASNLALVVAAGAVVTYAIAADGYQAHETELNDGGIWVVNVEDGLFGRQNKPINQLDGIVYANEAGVPIDVAQDGAAVVAIDGTTGTAQAIDPLTSQLDPTRIALPDGAQVRMVGGSLAVLDPAKGNVLAMRFDAQLGKPLLSPVDREADPLVKAGDGAAMTVTAGGVVVATSSEKEKVYRLKPTGSQGFAKATSDELPEAAGAPTTITAVGERIVTLDGESGELHVLDGASANLPQDSVLQAPGPASDSVLVATPTSLLSVDLDSGDSTVIDEGSSNDPIEPVRLGACVYGAWSGGLGDYVVQCGSDEAKRSSLGGSATNLAFRVNRGEIVLNDINTGAVWNIDTPEPERIDNWNAFTATKKTQDDEKENEDLSRGDRRPPNAEADEYGARPGRTTVLHPLDNDSAPEGRILSIVDVDQPASGGGRVEISPDGQTLVLELPEDARDSSFDYYIDDGRTNFSAHATVSVDVRNQTENQPPHLREGYEPTRWRVPAGGSMTVPVLSDWRDDADGDSLVLDSATALTGEDSTAVARTTADGRIRFTGSREGGEDIRVEYEVSDGRVAPVKRELTFVVQERLDRDSFPAVAQPDVVRGEVGEPIKIRPLLNDLPGSDPANQNAELELAGKISGQANATIKTDVENGVISFEASKPNTYFLDYDAAYGNAAVDKATVRVDVRPKPETPGDPVAMPDVLTLYGQAAGVVDVLANDLDPAGGLLVVQRAEADNRNQLDVAVIDGRWLRISSRQVAMNPNPQIVRYTISNGARTGVQGEVSVSQRPEPADNTPVTTTDRVRVRAGSSVTAAVLDNDISPSGDRLNLVGDAALDTAGELDVDVPVDIKDGNVGRAFVSGRTVRYIAPAVEERENFTVHYIAQNTSGQTAPGRLEVVVTPEDAPNTAPEPPALEARLVSGAKVKIRLPGSGVDPDGDPVTIGGITSAPELGRVLSVGGNVLEYQAYPRSVGTDEFEFRIVDTHGAVATGSVRLAVVPQDRPQAPLAVPDRLTVEPGRTAVFDPMANDYVAPGTEPVIELRDPPEGVELDPDTQLVTVQTPDSLNGESPPIVYALSNGLDTSIATMKVDLAEDFNNPPVVYDAFGQAEDSDRVEVNVLEGAYDPDGSTKQLTLSTVFGTDGKPRIEAGGVVSADRGANPIVVPFEVTDADGAVATASLYVPPTGAGIPYVKPDALIELDEGERVSGDIGDYVVNPSGGELRLNGQGSVSATPISIVTNRNSETEFNVAARDGYRGPGAVLLEVTASGQDAEDAAEADAADPVTVLLSIPVQVGDDRPDIQCPSDPIPLSAGDEKTFDITSVCTVWTPDPADAFGLEYELDWRQEVDGVDFSGDGSSEVTVSAAGDASQGGIAVLTITSNGSEPAEIWFRLSTAPPPTMLSIPVEDMRAGQSREINLAPYLESSISDPQPTVVSVETIRGSGMSASKSGQASVTLRAADGASGRAAFRVVMSDIDDESPPASRRAEGTITFEVAGVPSAPSRPLWFVNEQRDVVMLTWGAPKDNGGSPITGYVVLETKSGDRYKCRTTECDIAGLNERRGYAFKVAAVNKSGTGPWSELSKTAFAETPPGRVRNIRKIAHGDHTVTLAWSKPESMSKIKKYRISWRGQPGIEVSGSTLSYQVGGLNNNNQYVFSIEALNDVAWSGTRQSAPFQSVGTPLSPTGLAVTDTLSTGLKTSVKATWASTLPEGPAPTKYTLNAQVKGGQLTQVPGCIGITATTCTHQGVSYDGSNINYFVTASNVDNTSSLSTPAPFVAIAKPAEWGNWDVVATGADMQVRASGATPHPRGAQGRAAILVGGRVEWEQPVGVGAIVNELVSTQNNESPIEVQLRLCNEQNLCTYSEPKRVQSYGPLGDRHLNVPSSQVNGKTVVWSISGTSNGDAALLDIEFDGSPVETVTLEPGPFSISRSMTAQDWEHRTTISVRIYDNSPAGRGEGRQYAQTYSGPAPPPSLTISKGAQCSTASGADPNCTTAGNYGSCEASTCTYVRLAYTNEGKQANCEVERWRPIWGWNGEKNFNLPTGTATIEQLYYYGEPGHSMRVRCGNTLSNEIGW